MVLGHYHRPVIIDYMGITIIELPSFQLADRPLRNIRGMVLVRDDEFKIVKVPASKREELNRYWKSSVRI